jgi:hypothetical protein
MAWSSKYNAKFTKLVVRQLVAMIQRDQRAALDFVGGVNALAGFVGYQIAGVPIDQCPAILIVPAETLFNPDAQGSLESANRFIIAIAVANQDRQVLAELIQDYVMAVDAMLNTMPLSDFWTAMSLTMPALGTVVTTPLEVGSVKDLFVAAHRYDQIRNLSTDGFRMAATLEVHIHREET